MSEPNSKITADKSDGSQEPSIQNLRQLLLGEDYQLVRDVIKEESRDLVSNVLTEALHDRQKSDGSVSGILTPLVEKSVESSVTSRKTQFVSYLYPLVGSLVRKAVSSSLAEIVEKTNELLESSFTYKGLRWRFEARRAGISYSQYVVQQTFEFRVEQVLLIHYETGLLLRTVVHDSTQATDGDMFSGMLTAINDFVSDSFSREEGEQSLDEIKTDDFTLLIKRGPKAILVAAITGTPPANTSDKLQLTLETIHQIYHDELGLFEGDASVFENADQQLSSCLIAKQKIEETQSKKKPWLAIVLFALGFGLLCSFLVKNWYLDYIVGKVSELRDTPGIVLLNAERCDSQVCLDVLRDPFAEEVKSWVSQVIPSTYVVNVHERAYRSLDPSLLSKRLEGLETDFPELHYNFETSKFTGTLSKERFKQLNMRLNAMPEANLLQRVLDDIHVSKKSLDDSLLTQFIFEKTISDIKKIQISFDVGKSELSEDSRTLIKTLSKRVIKVNALSEELGGSFLLLIMGVSTNSGTVSYNQKLNFERAKVVEKELIENGVRREYLNLIDAGSLSNTKPKVIFDVLTLPTETLR